MIKAFRTAACACLLFAVAVSAAAQDCDKQQFSADDNIVRYFFVYSEKCTARQVKSQLQRWKVGPVTGGEKRDEANMVLMVPAWRDIGSAAENIARDATKGSGVHEVATSIAHRANIAASALALTLEGHASTDSVVYRNEIWDITEFLLLKGHGAPGQPLAPLVVGKSLEKDCVTRDSDLCKKALQHGKELMLQWRLAYEISFDVSAATIRQIAGQVAEKEKRWQRYVYDSKPMMLFDFVFTDLMEGSWGESDQYRDGVPVPPRNQWFLLHPSVGVEYASAAADGQQMKPVLYLEVLGVNRWDEKDRWVNAPVLRWLSGAGLVVSYADREGIKDTGYGLVLTFENVYTVGFTRYGSDNGVFLSLDLANLFRDKLKPQYQAARIIAR